MAVTKIWTIKDSLQRVLDYREQPIFTDPDGHVPHPDAFTRHLRKLYLNVHSLRHTNASLLGHAQASTTLDIYAHAFDKNKRKAQEKLGKAIGL